MRNDSFELQRARACVVRSMTSTSLDSHAQDSRDATSPSADRDEPAANNMSNPSDTSEPLRTKPSFIVGIGASAGGLEALVRLDHILETPRMGVDGERGLQHKGQRPIQRTRSACRRRQTCARVQCSVSALCTFASVCFRPDRLFCMRRFF